MVPADVLYMYNWSHLPHDYPLRQMNRMTSTSVLFFVFDRPTRNTDPGREHVAELKRGWQMLHRIKTREIREPDLVRWSDRVLPRHPISVLQSRTPWEIKVIPLTFFFGSDKLPTKTSTSPMIDRITRSTPNKLLPLRFGWNSKHQKVEDYYCFWAGPEFSRVCILLSPADPAALRLRKMVTTIVVQTDEFNPGALKRLKSGTCRKLEETGPSGSVPHFQFGGKKVIKSKSQPISVPGCDVDIPKWRGPDMPGKDAVPVTRAALASAESLKYLRQKYSNLEVIHYINAWSAFAEADGFHGVRWLPPQQPNVQYYLPTHASYHGGCSDDVTCSYKHLPSTSS
ncbi:hypothetical protein I7I51_00549 [Histoplasma capsulatum]|uniref:Uncharacterized protein n=1 Tax=Ajellomyces capsulatus TaxID=5037 RepID=A0A8A1MBZ2_AJECA|nr:hypothetical protein I7I51_00549 [Histoplasma capsulatum]